MFVGKYETLVDGAPVSKALFGIDVTFDGERLVAASAGTTNLVWCSNHNIPEGVFIFEVESGKQLHHISLESVARAVSWNKKPDDQVNMRKDNSGCLVRRVPIWGSQIKLGFADIHHRSLVTYISTKENTPLCSAQSNHLRSILFL